jgi:hypothetical protein
MKAAEEIVCKVPPPPPEREGPHVCGMCFCICLRQELVWQAVEQPGKPVVCGECASGLLMAESVLEGVD